MREDWGYYDDSTSMVYRFNWLERQVAALIYRLDYWLEDRISAEFNRRWNNGNSH